MKLVESIQNKPKTVLGLDTSTNSMAFALIKDDKLINFGKINFYGSDIYERLADANKKTRAFADQYEFDFVCSEASVAVRSVQIAIKMAMVNGVILANLSYNGAKITTVAPLSWQKGISNSLYSKMEKLQIKKENPGKTPSWLANEIRKRRKQYTIDFVNDLYNINVTDNDVADAIGIAYWAMENI